jgi:hypothetical protein
VTEPIVRTVITGRYSRVCADADPAPEMPHPFRDNYRFKPYEIDVTYHQPRGGVWRLHKLTVYGQYIYETGKTGSRTSIGYVDMMPLPDWVSAFVKENQPSLPAATPLHIDAACCQSCGWRGLESEVAHVMRSDGIAIECPMCPSTDINYCARTQTDG